MLRNRLLVQTARVFRRVVLVQGVPPVLVIEEGLLDLPVVLLGTDAEFEILFGDVIPELRERS